VIRAHEIVGVLQGAVSETLDTVFADKGSSFSASIVTTAHRSKGREMHSLGSFAMVYDSA
jgi:hypothetical protein